MLIVVSWCTHTPWCLLMLACMLWMRPYLFLSPSACAWHQESIIIARNKKRIWGECNSTILIVIMVPSACAVPWRLLVLTRVLRRRPNLFLAPSACAGHQESIISKKQNLVSAIAPVWLLCLSALCLHGCQEGALAPCACGCTLTPLYSYEERLVHAQVPNDVRGQLLVLFFYFVHVISHATPTRVAKTRPSPGPLQCETGCARPVLLIFMGRKGLQEQSKWSKGVLDLLLFFLCVRVLTSEFQLRARAKAWPLAKKEVFLPFPVFVES